MIKPILVTAVDLPVPEVADVHKSLRSALKAIPGFSVLLLSLLVLAELAGSHGQAAAPPANDTCANPRVVPRSGPFPYTAPVVDVTGATTSTNDPVPTMNNVTNTFIAERITRSVWYQFTPAASAIYTMTTCSDAGAATTINDTVLGVYTSTRGCSGPFTQVGDFGDEECGASDSQASVSLPLAADTTYYIVVWKFCDACVEDGLNALQLIVNGSNVAPNDTCSGALPLTLGLPVVGTTVGASDDLELTGTNGFGGLDQIPSQAAGRDVVYSFTAPGTGDYSFKALGYAVSQDLTLYVLTNCPAGPGMTTLSNALAAANRSRVNSAEEIVCLPLTSQQKVWVVVDDASAGNAGSAFSLEVTRCFAEREPNDYATNASTLACGVVGSIYPQFDADFYALGRYPAGYRVFAMVDGEAARTPVFEMRITAGPDTLEFDTDDNDTFFGDSSPNVAGTPLTGIPAYVRVSYDADLRTSEPYRLYAVVQPPIGQAAQELEPNGDITQANTDDRNYFYGVLQGPGHSTDVDVYAFSVGEGDLVFVSLDGDPYRTNSPINARLELLDASGNLVLAVNDPNASSSTNGIPGSFPTSPAEALIYRSPVEGAFFVRVSISPTATGLAASGDYLLSITKNCVIGAVGLPHPPVLTNVVMATPVTAGFAANLTGTIWQADTGNPTRLSVAWGDGTTNTLDFGQSGVIDFTVPHVFPAASQNQTITVTARDRAGNSVSVSRSFLVRPQPGAARFRSITVLPSGRISLALEGTPNAFYRIEKADSLGAWTELGNQGADAAGHVTFEDPNPVASTRFYRAVGKP
jgi:hypothetical protein